MRFSRQSPCRRAPVPHDGRHVLFGGLFQGRPPPPGSIRKPTVGEPGETARYVGRLGVLNRIGYRLSLGIGVSWIDLTHSLVCHHHPKYVSTLTLTHPYLSSPPTLTSSLLRPVRSSERQAPRDVRHACAEFRGRQYSRRREQDGARRGVRRPGGDDDLLNCFGVQSTFIGAVLQTITFQPIGRCRY